MHEQETPLQRAIREGHERHGKAEHEQTTGHAKQQGEIDSNAIASIFGSQKKSPPSERL